MNPIFFHHFRAKSEISKIPHIYLSRTTSVPSFSEIKETFFLHSFIIIIIIHDHGVVVVVSQGSTGRYYTARARLRLVVHYAFLVNKTIRLKHSTCKTSVGVEQDSNVWWKIFVKFSQITNLKFNFIPTKKSDLFTKEIFLTFFLSIFLLLKHSTCKTSVGVASTLFKTNLS